MSLLGLAACSYTACGRVRALLLGRPEARWDDLRQRAISSVPLVLAQSRVARPRYWYSGALHLAVFWGFVILQIRTLNFFLESVSARLSLVRPATAGRLWRLGGRLYRLLMPIMDLFNVLTLVGLAMAAGQRLFRRPKRLTLNWDGILILSFEALLMVSDVLINALEIAVAKPPWRRWSPVARAVAALLGRFLGGARPQRLRSLHGLAWFTHLLTFWSFLAYIPFSKHLHIITAPVNVFFRRLQPTGTLPLIENIEQAESFGAGKLQALSWKQMLDAYACTECGRCEVECPAFLTGKLLSPKKVIVDLREHLFARTPGLLGLPLPQIGTSRPSDESLIDAVGYEPIWDCVTCGACMQECPVLIEHVPTIMDMRRYLVMEEARMPETAQAALMSLEQRGHPWRGTQLTRTSWMEDLDIPLFDGSQEYLFWVGCTGALVERNVAVTRSIARLLQEAGVSFGVLGAEEGCSGDPARRLGNEYLFQIQAQGNCESFQARGVKKILTACPHCFNTFQNEYPQLGGRFQVVHHSQLLADLVAQGKLRPRQGLMERLTYHDACYLGRHNGVLEAPRQVLGAIPGLELLEMEKRGMQGFCCGAGGGHIWMEESRGRRVNQARTEQAAATGAQAVATACPFCLQMFEEGVGAVSEAAQREMRVFDIAEVLEVVVLPAPRRAGARPDGGDSS